MPTQCSPLRQETRRQGRGHRPGEPISRPDILIQSITAKWQVLKPLWRSIYACAWVVLNQYQLLTGNNTFLQLWTPRTGWGLPPNLSELDSSHRSLFTCTAWWSSTCFSYVSLTNQQVFLLVSASHVQNNLQITKCQSGCHYAQPLRTAVAFYSAHIINSLHGPVSHYEQWYLIMLKLTSSVCHN